MTTDQQVGQLFLLQPRIFAARTSARILLLRLWDASTGGTEFDFLQNVTQSAAEILGLRVNRVHEHPEGPHVAGIFERESRIISIATKFPTTSQKFTCAHEIGHFLLHPGQFYFRDRESNACLLGHREHVEIEADAFAAEFLMPKKYLINVFAEMFGGPIDGRVPSMELFEAVTSGKTQDKPWTPRSFAEATAIARAEAISTAHTFRGRFFSSLVQQFGVSRLAMAIRLVQLGLVR